MSLRELIPTSFADLLNLFGISLQGQKDNSFVLIGEVQPVVLVGSTTEIQSISTPITCDVPFTAGFLVAPALNTIAADTLAQPAGLYAAKIVCGGRPNSGIQIGYAIERRDAANAANIWSQDLGLWESGIFLEVVDLTVRLQINERLRVRVTGAATMSAQANIWLQRIGD